MEANQPRQSGLAVPSTARRFNRQALAMAVLFLCAALWQWFGAAPNTGDVAHDAVSGDGHFVEDDLPEFMQHARNLHEVCTGTCTSEEEDTIQSDLDSAFLMLNHKMFENPQAPRLKEEKTGWIIMYVIIMFYMFAGLAVVCDEFFVPALEAFVDHFQIPMDVAGATFMAAGGSMPELSTAFISTFQETDVGFAAIVGSAVFNVLFVIAVCVVASPTALKLKGWPLARDCTFYVIALATVVFVFIGPQSKNEIEWWEACLLLLEYVGYATFMKFNGRIHEWFRHKVKRRKVSPDDETAHMRGEASVTPAGMTFVKPSAFRKGIVQMLTQQSYLYETAGIIAVTQIKGDMEETFQKLDKDGDGALDTDEIKALLTMLGSKADTEAVRTALRRIARKGDDKILYEDFKRWYLMSEARIDMEVRRVFDSFDKNGNGTINRDEIMLCLQALGHKATVAEADALIIELQKPESGDDEEEEDEEPDKTQGDDVDPTKAEITFEQFERWYATSMFYKGKQDMVEKEANDDDCLSLDAPDRDAGWAAWTWYAFTYPIVAALYCTLPDVRNPRWKRNWKMAVVAFLLCLVWIYAFSNMLYECIIVISNTLRIPNAVAAVTVLAAGTSIPDLLSSYIVAKQGEGDMAVSSSIGSNIFDVTVGLPLPWLCFNIIRGKVVTVQSNNLGFSVIVLIIMLICVVGTIVAMKWRMTYGLGVVMMILYWIFVAQDLLQQLPEGDPVFKISF